MELTHREWSLLGLLLKQLGQVVGREEVLAVWQTQAPEGVAGGAGGGGASGAGGTRIRQGLVSGWDQLRGLRRAVHHRLSTMPTDLHASTAHHGHARPGRGKRCGHPDHE
jgi:hypothetical protein